ncbi:MAG TPA: hypothetical protein VGV89_07945 [Thermoplasmata archaeon]|nr:hypothetical protein [Thermoplasmata archaeon]
MARFPSAVYRISQEFDAPIDFVFRWCTDYSPQDAALEKEHYERRILARSSKQVTYEDLESDKNGWVWRRYVVDLLPPDRWHAESVGNRRLSSIDYRLTELPGARTRLDFVWRRTGIEGYPRNPPKRATERDATRDWENFGRALERDYRKSRRG